MSTDYRGRHLADFRGTDRRSCARHTAGASAEPYPPPGPYRRSISSSRRMSADSAITSPARVANEVLAFEINSPSTSAEIVATTAIDTETRVLVASVN